MANDVADILDRAADLIEPEGAWTQRTIARDARGNCVTVSSPEAVSFCAAGAVFRVTRPELLRLEAIKLVLRAAEAAQITDWNDEPKRTQAEVLTAFRQAAEIARAEQVQPC